MEQFTRRVRLIRRRAFFDFRGIVAVAGVLLSIVLHEAFHALMHWGDITHIYLFPNSHAIVAMDIRTPYGYDVRLEEAVAYAITVLTLVATAAVVAKLHDKKDTRTSAQIIMSKHSSLKTLSQKEFFELASRIRLL